MDPFAGCALRRWPTTDDIPADASRHGGPGRADIEWRVNSDGTIVVREREHAALFGGYVTADRYDSARDGDGWFDTGDIGRAYGPDYLVFLERRAESIRVKRRVRSHPVRREASGRHPRHRRPRPVEAAWRTG